jgi:hypothetical protein
MTPNEFDGGTAFPFALNCPGMSLRDYFAGQALTGLLANGCDKEHDVADAYYIADQMISRRKSAYKRLEEENEKNRK